MRSEMHQGFALYPGMLDRAAQIALLDAVLACETRAPFYRPIMPRTGTNGYQAIEQVLSQPWLDMPLA